MKIFIGTAGWSIPSQYKEVFQETGSHLARYAQIFNCVEINSSFYREHKFETYVKWANLVPDDFRFSVKLSRSFTQDQRLREVGSRLEEVLHGISGLGQKWGALLVQLPPSLEFDLRLAQNFFRALRENYSGSIVCEPRHKSWSQLSALQVLKECKINKVLADPEPCPLSKEQRPAVEEVRYLRLHGQPQIYKSSYSDQMISRIRRAMTEPISPASQTWCIFDNTTYGFAILNAIELQKQLSDPLRHDPSMHQEAYG